ncbi:MAG: orotidine-5'-phosphate decarboxylase [Trueperella sp.]|nr:orotidine-5'-phosphate decarboxylase [Trueperella sp.]
MSYGEIQLEYMNRYGAVCAGIDPHPQLLRDWELTEDAAGLREFSLRTVEALAGEVAAVKPQSAFFERFGAAGIAVLEEVLDAARAFSLLSILDVKRGDIGSTMAGYAHAYLAADSPLRADAITLSPYLGPASLLPTINFAAAQGRGVYVLALTSNPEAVQLQHLGGQHSVARAVVETMRQANGDANPGPVGIVVGATVGDAPQRLQLDLAHYNGIILAPGVGAQGAGAAEIAAVYGRESYVLASASRSILAAGPRPDELRSAARAVKEQVKAARA